MRFRRRVPAAVVEMTDGDERVLAWSPSGGDGWVVATDKRLRATDPVLDVSWVEVVGAGWDSPLLTVRLWSAYGDQQVVLSVEEGRTLPQVVRERVEETLLVQTKVPVDGAKGVRFLARRVPGTGETLWQHIADPGLNIEDPRVRARIDAAQQQLHELFGV